MLCAHLFIIDPAAEAADPRDAPAHQLVDRFSREAEQAEARSRAAAEAEAKARQAQQDEARRSREMEDLLARAKREAEELQRVLDAEGERARVAAEERARAAAEAERRLRLEAEARVAQERAAREEAERKLQRQTEALAAQQKAAREAEQRQAAAAEAARRAEREAAEREAAEIQRVEAERAREQELIAEKLRRAGEELDRARRVAAPVPSPTVTAPQPPAATGGPPPGPADAAPAVTARHAPRQAEPIQPGGEQTVTVLLVMQPGSRGIRRYNKTSDPVLCVQETCYASRGPGVPARAMTRWQAFGTLNTLGRRADACSNHTGCVFRGVNLEAARALVQPVDLRLIRHDRREVREVAADPTCRLSDGGLRCDRPVIAETYRMWVVGESIARQAGGAALSDALEAKLETSGP